MDCPLENGAFTDRTGTNSAMASQATALRQAEAAPAAGSNVANAALAMDAANREELAAVIEAEANLGLETQAFEPAPLAEGETVEPDPVPEDEGPLDALNQVEDNADTSDQGIPQDVLDAPVNPAAATGDKPAEKKAGPVDSNEKKLVQEPVKAETPAPEGDPAQTKADEAAETDTATDDTDAAANTGGIDTTGMTPEEILAAAAAANADGAGGDTAGGDAAEGEAPIDMGAGTAITADMCPMEAAEMMAGETATEMADTMDAMMGDTNADMEMADMTVDDMG